MPPLDLRHRGTLREVEWLSLVGGLPHDSADRQATRLRTRLRALGVAEEGERVPLPVHGSAGHAALVVATFERIRTGHAAVGAAGAGPASPEQAADGAVEAFRSHLERGGAVDGLLGEQLLLPAAILAAGLVPPPAGVVPATRYTVSEVTGHLLATAHVIGRFLEVEVAVLGHEGEPGEVRVQPPGGALEVAPLPATP
jgi:RNA 3'-terminal phosphate cyclase (ATP)